MFEVFLSRVQAYISFWLGQFLCLVPVSCLLVREEKKGSRPQEYAEVRQEKIKMSLKFCFSVDFFRFGADDIFCSLLAFRKLHKKSEEFSLLVPIRVGYIPIWKTMYGRLTFIYQLLFSKLPPTKQCAPSTGVGNLRLASQMWLFWLRHLARSIFS